MKNEEVDWFGKLNFIKRVLESNSAKQDRDTALTMIKEFYTTVWDLKEFQEGQWWVEELDGMVKSGTPDQKRAVVVVHNLLTQLKNYHEIT